MRDEKDVMSYTSGISSFTSSLLNVTTSAGRVYPDECCPDCRQMTAGDCGKRGQSVEQDIDIMFAPRSEERRLFIWRDGGRGKVVVDSEEAWPL